eukprot:6470170-Pyramimonas_sp.AAC.2
MKRTGEASERVPYELRTLRLSPRPHAVHAVLAVVEIYRCKHCNVTTLHRNLVSCQLPPNTHRNPRAN